MDSQTGRDRDGQVDKQTQRQTGRDRDRQVDNWRQRQTGRQVEIDRDRQKDY